MPIIIPLMITIIASPISIILLMIISTFVIQIIECGFFECGNPLSGIGMAMWMSFITMFMPYLLNFMIGVAACIEIAGLRRKIRLEGTL